MDKCIGCNKEYTKRGIKLHHKKCKDFLKNINIKSIEETKIILKNKIDSKSNNFLLDDCIKNIYEFIFMPNKYIDKNITYYNLYRDLCNISFVCKNFYLNCPSIHFMKDEINLEIKEKICRSKSKIYGLTDEELDTLDYKISKRHMGGCYHLFNIIDIKNKAYMKYGTNYDYEKYLIKKQYIKSLTKKERDFIYEKNKNTYDNLFIKYDYINNQYLKNIYDENIDSIKNFYPNIEIIEKKIKLKINLVNELKKNNIDYFETKEVIYYINDINDKDKYDIYDAIKSLNNRIIKEKKYKEINKNYDLLAYKFIDDNDKDINDLFSIINNVEIIKKNIDENICISHMNDIDKINIYIDNIVCSWFNKNKSKLENSTFIEYFDNKLQEKIKNIHIEYLKEKEKKINDIILRNKIIDDLKNGIKIKKNIKLKCKCNNTASYKCIDYLCRKCCNNYNCYIH